MKYHTINSNIWEEDEFHDFSDGAKLLFFYLFTNSRCPISGMYKIRIGSISHDLMKPLDTVTTLLKELDGKWISYDFSRNVVWVKGKLKHHKSSWKTWRVLKSVLDTVLEFQDCCFMSEFYQKYPTAKQIPEMIDSEILKETKKKSVLPLNSDCDCVGDSDRGISKGYR